MRLFIAALALVALTARADLDMQYIDGNDIGIGQTLEAHYQDALTNNTQTWLWGSTGWTDPSGSYVYFTFHRYGDGFLFKLGADGNYTNITPTPPDDNTEAPAENRPMVFDVNNDGFMDILHTGDETPKSASLLNNGDGTWTYSKQHRLLTRGDVVDVNGDGYLDVVSYSTNRARDLWGTGTIKTTINLSGLGFEATKEPIVLPADAPQEVVDRVSEAADRFHMTKVYTLDADTYIVAYGGAYGGQKFNYIVRNGQVADIGLPQEGMPLKPRDIDGDGDMDIVIQYGSVSGIYRQGQDGRFARDEAGYMPTINSKLRVGAYAWDVWPIDLDQDGDNDLVLSNKRSGRGWILDNTDGVYLLNTSFSHVDGEAVWPADIDGDGDIDVVAAAFSSGSARNGNMARFYINNLDPDGNPDPIDCSVTPSHPSCPPVDPVDCTVTPDHPSCPPVDPVDCDVTPDDPSCPPVEPDPKDLIGLELAAAKLAISEASGQTDQGRWESVISALTQAIGKLNAAIGIAEGAQEPNFP